MGHPERGGNPQMEALVKEYQQLVAEYQKAQAKGDEASMARLAPQIQELQKQLQ